MKNLNEKIVLGFLTIALTANAAFVKGTFRTYFNHPDVQMKVEAIRYAIDKNIMYSEALKTWETLFNRKNTPVTSDEHYSK